MITNQITEAFAAYGAELVNIQWAISAELNDGSIVVCLWQKFLVPSAHDKGSYRYEDSFYRLGVNKNGKKLMREHLRKALDSTLAVRLIIVSPENPVHWKAIEEGKAATKFRKAFDVRKTWLGKVVELTDDRFVIEFETGAKADKGQ